MTKLILALAILVCSTASQASERLPPEADQAYHVALAFIQEINDAGAAVASRHLFRDSFEWIGFDGRAPSSKSEFVKWTDTYLVSVQPDRSDWRIAGAEHFRVEGKHGSEVFLPLTFNLCEKIEGSCLPGAGWSVRKIVRFQFEYRPGYLTPTGPPIRRLEIVG